MSMFFIKNNISKYNDLISVLFKISLKRLFTDYNSHHGEYFHTEYDLYNFYYFLKFPKKSTSAKLKSSI